ncbi:MAG TPA: hypothetical protein VGM56_16775 [Byssovorax sp.]|jgi:hypothetical protein
MMPLVIPLVALAIGAALALVVVRATLLGYPPPRLPDAKMLSRKEQAVIGACSDAFFPAGGPIPVSGNDAGLVAYMDDYLGRMTQASRVLVRLLFVLLEHGPWLFGPRRARFTRLAHEDRMRFLDKLRASDVYFLRVAFLSMRTMLTMGYLANADVARSMGMRLEPSPFAAHAAAA